jgi:hypothetical protein
MSFMKPQATTQATYKKMREVLANAIEDLEILAGNRMGPSNVTWQDVAGTCYTNLRVLANQIEAARSGNHEPAITFPSPAELLGEME